MRRKTKGHHIKKTVRRKIGWHFGKEKYPVNSEIDHMSGKKVGRQGANAIRKPNRQRAEN